MIALTAFALASLAVQVRDFEVQPRTIRWEELSAGTFDLRQRLPETRRTKSRDLVREMRALLALRFEIPGTPKLRSFGDIAAAAAPLAAAERVAWLERLAQRSPKLFEKNGEALRELLLDDRLHSKRWDPDEDDSRDGMYFVEAWDLDAEKRRPWSELRVDPTVQQGAALVRSDLTTWKEVENDYRHYSKNVGADYEEIYPVPGSYRRGRDPEGRAFSCLKVKVRCDLPFPFSGYTCDLRILNRETDDGLLITDIYSPSNDFHWMAGRDVFLPVTTSEGESVGYVVVRLYGFDLDDVPDRAKHIRAALRASLGNLKRKVEARPRRISAKLPTNGEMVPPFRVLGAR